MFPEELVSAPLTLDRGSGRTVRRPREMVPTNLVMLIGQGMFGIAEVNPRSGFVMRSDRSDRSAGARKGRDREDTSVI